VYQSTLGRLFAQALERNHDTVAVFDGAESYSYGALAERVGKLLTLFTEQGYAPGHRIGLAMPMSFDFLSWYIATQIGGLAYCDLPPAMPVEALALRTEVGELRTVVIDPGAFGAKLEPLLAAIDAQVITLSPHGDFPILSGLLADCPPQDVRCREPGTYSTIAFTGGSTGLPKLEGFSGEAGAALALTLMATAPFPAAPVTIAYRTAGAVMQLGVNQTLIRGGKIITLPDFDLNAISEAARTHRANNFFLATRTIATLADQPDVDWMRGQIEMVIHGGEPIAPTQIRKAIERLGPIFVGSYGTNETGGTAALLLPNDHDLDRPEILVSAGRALPGVEIEIRDEAGAVQSPGEIGEIAIRSCGQMECYIGQPEKTAATIRDGWIHTGDLGRMDAAGYLTIVDRTAFAVKSEGKVVYPRLIDAHFSEHPAVSAAVTVPIEDKLSSHRICVAVTLRSGMDATEEELARFVAARPDAPTVHHVMIFDRLPQMAANLKIDRAKLRSALEGRMLALSS